MRTESPISVGKIQFYTYDQDQTDKIASIDSLPFDDRTDFISTPLPGGIAIKITFHNQLYDTGVRRNVALNLIDITTRCEVSSQNVKVSMRKHEFTKESYADFPADGIKPGRSYRLVISDIGVSQTIAEKVFHLFDKDRLPHPAEWYGISDGGLRPAWVSLLYKTLDTTDGHEYYLRFNLEYKLGYLLSGLMPELELRLYYPEGRDIEAQFREPRCLSEENYNDNRWFVEFPFTTSFDRNGVFYAELLCMEYPIAGFVFDTNADDECGSWCGPHIAPLDEYTPEAAFDRWQAGSARAEECRLTEPEEPVEQSIVELCEEKPDADTDADEDSPDTGRDNVNESIMASLDNLTGLHSVKERLSVYERVVRFNKMRADNGLPTTSTPLHAMFLGSPGTGKSTVAKMMGTMLHHAGVLSKGHVVQRERSTLLGQNYNSEAEKTLAAIKEAQGGILFIDEAYQLYQP
ncbi:MAG: AAA family ATPase, partial [Muribaculaceae bacterium]|nr:AAA family ATPase [Muribaculaceae bacterium]